MGREGCDRRYTNAAASAIGLNSRLKCRLLNLSAADCFGLHDIRRNHVRPPGGQNDRLPGRVSAGFHTIEETRSGVSDLATKQDRRPCIGHRPASELACLRG